MSVRTRTTPSPILQPSRAKACSYGTVPPPAHKQGFRIIETGFSLCCWKLRERKQHLALQRFYRRLETDALIVRGSGALYQLLGLGEQGEGLELAAFYSASA